MNLISQMTERLVVVLLLDPQGCRPEEFRFFTRGNVPVIDQDELVEQRIRNVPAPASERLVEKNNVLVRRAAGDSLHRGKEPGLDLGGIKLNAGGVAHEVPVIKKCLDGLVVKEIPVPLPQGQGPFNDVVREGLAALLNG